MTNFKAGNLYYDVPEDEYYTDAAISNSDLKLIGESPRDWVAGIRETTAAMEKGRAFHCYIGEREKFKKSYVKTPLKLNEKGEIVEMRLDARTQVYKDICAKYPGKQLLKHADLRDLYWTKEAIKSDANAMALMSLPHHSEVSGWFEYREPGDSVGIPCRFRMDRLAKKGDTYIIIDFKKVSTRHGMYLTEDTIERYNRSYGCVQQAAFYRYGLRQILGTDNVIFVNIYLEMNANKRKSLGCVASAIPEYLLSGSDEHGEGAIRSAIISYKKYQANGWPTHAEHIINRQIETGIISEGIPSIGIGGWL